MSTDIKIKIEKISKKYPNKVIHLENISLTQKVTMFIGENGSGKSTILKAIVNLINYEGNISCNETYSYMPENPIFPINITVKQFLSNLHHMSKNDYDYYPFILQYGLKNKLNDEISTLSKGMKAKLNLIQCLLRNTDIYILDEPLNGLDEESVKTLVSYMKQSTKHYIISTHLENAFQDLDKEIINIYETT